MSPTPKQARQHRRKAKATDRTHNVNGFRIEEVGTTAPTGRPRPRRPTSARRTASPARGPPMART